MLSARARETLALTTVVLLVVAVATAAHLLSLAQVTLRAAADEGRLLARQLYHQAAHTLTGPAPQPEAWRRDAGIRALLDGMVGYSRTVVYAAITDPAGRALVHSDPAAEGATLRPRPRVNELQALGAVPLLIGLLGEPRLYEAQLPLRLNERPFGVVHVGISTTLVRQELMGALRRSVLLGVAATLVAVAIGLGAGRALLRLGRRIARGVGRLARGELGREVDLQRGDTMGALAAEMDRLGERLQAERSRPGAERDAVVVLDGRRRVAALSTGAERLLGLWGVELGDAVGRRLDQVLPPAHPLRAVATAIEAGGRDARDQEVTVSLPGGASRELAVSSYRLQAGTSPGGAILVVQDVEPVRAVDSLVTYAQKLAALGRLMSGVAHEVKNPLNAMRIHLELLRVRLPGASPEIDQSLEVIGQEIARLDRVVQGFLRFTRPQDLTLEPVDLNALCREVARLAGPEAAQAGAEVALDLAPDLPAVTGDAGLLQQACTNLVVNGIQAMPKGGTLTLRTRRASPTAVTVTVHDQGVGIPPEDLDRVFRLYYTTKEGGSGLGLPLVYRTVQLHGGRIEVASSVGDGTTMTVTLPLEPGGAP